MPLHVIGHCTALFYILESSFIQPAGVPLPLFRLFSLFCLFLTIAAGPAAAQVSGIPQSQRVY
jgi:hypothetical protein